MRSALLWLLGLSPALYGQLPSEWRPVGHLDVQRIPESSGLVQSRRDPDLFWTHSDSGNPPVIFAVRMDGTIVAEVALEETINSDWEDMAADEKGHLYIGDIGNNFAAFPFRYIHKLEEPKDLTAGKLSVKPIARYAYQFSAERFDSESLIVWKDVLYILSKTQAGDAELYKLVARDETWLIPEKIAALPIPMATGADLSTDGKRLLVCTVSEAQWYELDENLIPRSEIPVRRLTYPRSQIEACAIAGQFAVFTNEKGQVYRVSLDSFQKVLRAEPPRDSTKTTR